MGHKGQEVTQFMGARACLTIFRKNIKLYGFGSKGLYESSDVMTRA